MPQRTFTLDGKRYRIPSMFSCSEIERVVNRLHVAARDKEVREEITSRTKGKSGWTEALIEKACLYALHVHRKNQALYHKVTKGVFK